MKNIVKLNTFDANEFRNDYINFMTTPGSHNDTYASTGIVIKFNNHLILYYIIQYYYYYYFHKYYDFHKNYKI